MIVEKAVDHNGGYSLPLTGESGRVLFVSSSSSGSLSERTAYWLGERKEVEAPSGAADGPRFRFGRCTGWKSCGVIRESVIVVDMEGGRLLNSGTGALVCGTEPSPNIIRR